MRKGVISTMFHDICRPSLPRKRLASSIGLERETFNLKVAGSSPALGFSFSFLNLQLSYELRADQSSYLDPSEIA